MLSCDDFCIALNVDVIIAVLRFILIRLAFMGGKEA